MQQTVSTKHSFTELHDCSKHNQALLLSMLIELTTEIVFWDSANVRLAHLRAIVNVHTIGAESVSSEAKRLSYYFQWIQSRQSRSVKLSPESLSLSLFLFTCSMSMSIKGHVLVAVNVIVPGLLLQLLQPVLHSCRGTRYDSVC